MPHIIFVKPDGSEHNVSVNYGVSVMEAVRDTNHGIEGTGGASLPCSSCHWIVGAGRFSNTGGSSEYEDDMRDHP